MPINAITAGIWDVDPDDPMNNYYEYTVDETEIDIGRRFPISEWDPFAGIFRITGSFHMLAIGVVFILGGMLIGRSCCRWLCPYGRILSIPSRFAWKNVLIAPDNVENQHQFTLKRGIYRR